MSVSNVLHQEKKRWDQFIERPFSLVFEHHNFLISKISFSELCLSILSVDKYSLLKLLTLTNFGTEFNPLQVLHRSLAFTVKVVELPKKSKMQNIRA